MKKYLFFLLISAMSIKTCLADSPLTSTEFYKAYENLPQFEDGSLALYAYLSDDTKPVEERLAVINQLSWHIEGKDRADHLLEYYQSLYGHVKGEEVFERMSGKQTICLAYLLAMDSYINKEMVETAFGIAKVAVEKDQFSFSVNMIAALIGAQTLFDAGDWCGVFAMPFLTYTDDDPRTVHDMKEEAIQIILDYTNLYAEDCQ